MMRPVAPVAGPTAGAVPPQAYELQARATGLDADNQNLQALLAQQQQQTAQLQGALKTSQKQVAELKGEVERARSLGAGTDVASSGKRGTSASRTNYGGGGGGTLPLASIKGAEVVPDGDVVRIRLEVSQLFTPGKAELKSGVLPILDDIAGKLRHDYAGRMIGIEGHTDPDPITKSKWQNNHELSLARSLAVFEALKKRGVSEKQLFVAGYGPNRPLTDNNSAQSKAQNRRVEIVVYP